MDSILNVCILHTIPLGSIEYDQTESRVRVARLQHHKVSYHISGNGE